MKISASDGPTVDVKVWLDGKPQFYVTEADDERGYVDVVPQPISLRYSSPCCIVRHRLFGRVRIELTPYPGAQEEFMKRVIPLKDFWPGRG
jgi:hypothetical protein